MKRFTSLVLALLLTLSMAVTASAANASGSCGENLTWTLKGTTLTISGTGAMEGSPWWPAYMDTITEVIIEPGVTSIGQGAFSQEVYITKVTLPDTLTSIGDSAFMGCRALTEIKLPESLTYIGGSAFSGCEALKELNLPKSLTHIDHGAFSYCSQWEAGFLDLSNVKDIGNAAFSGCEGLTSVKLPYGITEIGDNTFSGTGLTSITLPETVTSIGGFAFSGSPLQSINIPDGVTEISGRAFMGCDLRSISFPDGLKRIGPYAFSGNKNLTEIIIPDSVVDIGFYAFDRCHALSSVTLSKNLTVIKDHCFYETPSLTHIEIPNGITTIQSYAFTGLKTVHIPASVTKISDLAFDECRNLTSFTVDSANTVYYSRDGVLFRTVGVGLMPQFPHGITELTHCPPGMTGSYNIPGDVVMINEYAFKNSKLSTVGIPESVISIGDAAFLWSKISQVNYAGSAEQWKNISINSNSVPTGVTINYNTQPSNPFISDWAKEEVAAAQSAGLVPVLTGMPGYQDAITREQFAELVVNFVSKCGINIPAYTEYFTDCDNHDVLLAASAGIVNGVGSNKFDPNATTNREQIATMLYRAIGYIEEQTGQNPATKAGNIAKYTDKDAVSAWAVEGVGVLAANGIMKGTSDTTLSPKNPCTVEQSIILIYRLYTEYVAN